MLPFRRHTRPDGCAGSATATSSPRFVVICVVGPAGSGPTGGAAAHAGATRKAAAVTPARAVRKVMNAPFRVEVCPVGRGCLRLLGEGLRGADRRFPRLGRPREGT